MCPASGSNEFPSGIHHVDAPIVGDEERLPRDPMAALDKLTQLNGSSPSASAHACGAVSLVGAMLATAGYAGLVDLAERIGDELADERREELERLARAIAGGGPDATYGALADYALLIYRRYRGMDGGMEYRKFLHLMQRAGFSPPRRASDDDVARTLAQRGECWPAKISIFGDQGDHWILVGRDARGLFVFDPYPRDDGSQIIRPGEADWKRYVEAIGEDEAGRNTIGFLPAE
ncbi:hypothetical protein [Polyangium spumosum]|uniref:Peptidase C39-like domain-containing protein n=1 Tax=Polyangium spumosum TaxID=889282 RepID=A0A6N7PFF2_9BACT|nr:hypothetical protein [Polyangium spumosum]MRG90719.1 hypothetical protein [Polyangium spumosum]